MVMKPSVAALYIWFCRMTKKAGSTDAKHPGKSRGIGDRYMYPIV